MNDRKRNRGITKPGPITCMALAVALGGSVAQADFLIIDPPSATDTSHFSTTAAIHTIDSSGLTPGNPWGASTNGGSGGGANFEWESAVPGGLTISITWDLGTVYTNLVGFHLWNGNEINFTTRGISNATVLVSSDNFATTNFMGTMTFQQASGLNSYTGTDYSFPSLLNGRQVEFTGMTNFGGDGYLAISEIRFEALPEPSAAVLLVGAAGLLAWRRQGMRSPKA